MSRQEQVYDILDIIRVIRRAVLPVLLVPPVVAFIVGFLSFTGVRDAGFTERVHAVIRMPTSSIEVDEIEKSVLRAATTLGENEANFNINVEEIVAGFRTSYRTLRVTLESRSGVDGRILLESATQTVVAAVDAFDADLQRQLSDIDKRRAAIARYLAMFTDETRAYGGDGAIAEANAVASLVSAASIVEQDMRRLADLGRGPLQFVAPIEGPETLSNLRWLRLPIVAWGAALLVVLFVAFTLDGVRLARANRLR